jgi:glycerol-3-phosphate dehydrogenase
MSRFRSLDGLFDLLIIGGGIIGAGIARDASRRGLRVALLEKGDYGSGTTAGSTRLIHGGLRYLEMLDFPLVRMDLRERETLLRIAPHLVRPLEFLVPFYNRSLFYRAKLRAGMLLYDALSFDKSLPPHRFLTAAEAQQAEPQLRTRGLQGAAAYFDAQVNSPERLCLENVIDARRRQAAAVNYAEVVGAVREGDRVAGVRVRDLLEGGEAEVRARLVVNASGPWFDRVAARLAPHPQPLLRTTKGIHIAAAPVSAKAVVLFSGLDRRLFFVIPWLGYSWIGTTDTDFADDPSMARADDEDVDYLVASAREFFPAIASQPVYWSNAGVRALVTASGTESSLSRAHRIRHGPPGLISVLGGKITGYRAIAEEVTDAVCRSLRVKARCTTAEAPLPGAAGVRNAECGVRNANNGRAAAIRDPQSAIPPEAGIVEHLGSVYGSRAAEVLAIARSAEEWAAPLAPDCPDIAAQVAFAVREEQCVRLADFLLRRSLVGFRPDQGLGVAEAVASIMAEELKWTPARKMAEIRSYRELVERTQLSREVPL